MDDRIIQLMRERAETARRLDSIDSEIKEHRNKCAHEFRHTGVDSMYFYISCSKCNDLRRYEHGIHSDDFYTCNFKLNTKEIVDIVTLQTERLMGPEMYLSFGLTNND